MTLRNRTGPSGRVLLSIGIICLIAGIVMVVARLRNPTPGIVIAAAVGVIAGFTLTTSGILALVSRPVWIEGTVTDARWTIAGMRRIGLVMLDTGEADLLTVHLDPPVFREIGVGDRLRVQHNSLNRAQVYHLVIVSRAEDTAR